jgi:excisionase family DNA binding protein
MTRMTGLIMTTIEKNEFTNIVQEAVQSALSTLQLQKEQPPEEDLMTVKDVCNWLDMEPSTLYQKTHYKEIPYIKKGKRLYFSRAELKNWLSEGKKHTRVEEEQQADERLLLANKKRR